MMITIQDLDDVEMKQLTNRYQKIFIKFDSFTIVLLILVLFYFLILFYFNHILKPVKRLDHARPG